MVKIIMNGCNGKMGQAISKIVAADEEAEIAAGIDRYQEIVNPYPVFGSLEECTAEADVLIDFSTAAAVDDMVDWCVLKKMPVVICTTGLSKEQIEHIKEASEKTAVLRSAKKKSLRTLPGYLPACMNELNTAALDRRSWKSLQSTPKSLSGTD